MTDIFQNTLSFDEFRSDGGLRVPANSPTTTTMDFSCCGTTFRDVDELMSHNMIRHTLVPEELRVDLLSRNFKQSFTPASSPPSSQQSFEVFPGLSAYAKTQGHDFFSSSSQSLGSSFERLPSLAQTAQSRLDKEKRLKPYKCTYAACHKKYKNPSGLKYHLSRNHGLEGEAQNNLEEIHPQFRRYLCAICLKKFRNISGLRYHLLDSEIHIPRIPLEEALKLLATAKEQGDAGFNAVFE